MKQEIVIYSLIALIIGLFVGSVFFNDNETKNTGEKTNLDQQVKIFELEEKSQLGEPSIQFSFSEDDCSKELKDKINIESEAYQLKEIDCKIQKVFANVLNSHMPIDRATLETRAICYCTYSIN